MQYRKGNSTHFTHKLYFDYVSTERTAAYCLLWAGMQQPAEQLSGH